VTPVARVGGRLLVIDPTGRVLLIHERIQDGSTHWLTPGGGLEGDESPRVAAAREAAEEIGIAVELAPDAEEVLVTRRLWSWDGVEYDQVDHFFVTHVAAAFDPAPGGLTDVEKTTLLGFGWWSVDDLRRTDAVVVPDDLPDVLASVLAQATSG
jgi:8-oxo-dGTP pyrophosphatase MutT (NUDIX family)